MRTILRLLQTQGCEVGSLGVPWTVHPDCRHGSSLGGKSPIMLSLVADARHVIGVDLAHDRFMGAVVDLRGRIVQEEEQPVPPRDGDAAVAAV